MDAIKTVSPRKLTAPLPPEEVKALRRTWKRKALPQTRCSDGFQMFTKVPVTPKVSQEVSQTPALTRALPDPARVERHLPTRSTPGPAGMQIVAVEDLSSDQPNARDKCCQHPPPNPHKKRRTLAVQLQRREEKRKRPRSPSKRGKKKKKKKRRKVVTQYPNFQVPAFPTPNMNHVHMAFKDTPEAHDAKADPKAAFLTLTKMIVGAHKLEIQKVYKKSGPFGFLAEALCENLDLFERKAGNIDPNIVRFKRSLELNVRELEVKNAVKCIRKKREAIKREIEKMTTLRNAKMDGSLKRETLDMLGCSTVEPNEVKLAQEKLAQERREKEHAETLFKSHAKTSVTLAAEGLKFSELSLDHKRDVERQGEEERERELFRARVKPRPKRSLFDILATNAKWMKAVASSPDFVA